MDEREMSAVAEAANEEKEYVEEITDEASGLTDEEDVPADEISEEAHEPHLPDYAEIVESDLRALRAAYPELSEIKSITELENPLRYAELRDLGLSPKEAYLATGGHRKRADNRAHLSSAVPRGAGSPRSNMTQAELERARELFPGLGDAELHGLYKKVSI